MECLRKWSQSVEKILILSCGFHEPFTMGRSDGCEGLWIRPHQFSTLIWHSFLSLALVANRLKLLIFSVWLDCFFEQFHDNVEIDLFFFITKDSCDGSGLNTSESSKGSHP